MLERSSDGETPNPVLSYCGRFGSSQRLVSLAESHYKMQVSAEAGP